jgi:hypothetical protein
MVKNFFLFTTILLLASCKVAFNDLTMVRIPYDGNELRIDGYYYSNPDSEKRVGIAVFYRNGVCMYIPPMTLKSQNTFDSIENDILLNNAFISRLQSLPDCIGVFHINSESINLETWEAYGKNIITLSHFCKILNDTTFLLTKRVNNDTNKSYSLNETYRFKPFSQKPDSTNTFIK